MKGLPDLAVWRPVKTGRNCPLLTAMLLWLGQCKLYPRELQFPPQIGSPHFLSKEEGTQYERLH